MNADVQKTNRKAELLANTVEHVDIDQYDARPVIDAMRKMSFTARDTARAADILVDGLEDQACSTWLTLAGSTSRRRLHARLPRHGEVRDDRRGGRHRRLDRRHGFLRGPGLQALPGPGQRRRPRPARPLHRPHLRHLHRRGRAAELRRHDQRDRRQPGAAPLFLAASSSRRWASGWPPATPRSPAR